MSFKYRLFDVMFKMSSAAAQKASTKSLKFLVLLLYLTQPNPTYQKLKNLDPSQPKPTQPMGQPNPWTTLL